VKKGFAGIQFCEPLATEINDLLYTINWPLRTKKNSEREALIAGI
jgi:hypothetical protein